MNAFKLVVPPEFPSNIVWAVTGHRPQKLRIDYSSPHAKRQLIDFAKDSLIAVKPKRVIVGMAIGWDMACAQACNELGIPFSAAVPCKDQSRLWTNEDQRIYRELLHCADEVHQVSNLPYSEDPGCMARRNAYMVDQLHGGMGLLPGALLALWNGTAGGTSNCIEYAHSKHVRTFNVWGQWRTVREAHRGVSKPVWAKS